MWRSPPDVLPYIVVLTCRVKGSRTVSVRTLNRSYTPRTTRLLAEYLAQTYPHARIFQEFHLTAPNPEAVAAAGAGVSTRFGGTIMGFPDAAVVLSHEIQLWECKDSLTTLAIGQILAYGHMYRQSVESRSYPDHVLTLHLLVARDNPAMQGWAAQHGVEVAVFRPAWYDASLLRSASIAATRQQEQSARQIVARALAGRLTDEQAQSQIEGLGYTIDTAKLMIAEARDRVSDTGHAESVTEDS